MKIKAPLRTPDDFGEGHYGASRGGRTHNGNDYQSAVGSMILAPLGGTVTKLGYAYADDLAYRYVEMSIDNTEMFYRFFYVRPLVTVGESLSRGEAIGTSQDISARYDTDDKKMQNHVHVEVFSLIDGTRKYVNSMDYV